MFMEFNETPDATMINTIKKAQLKGDINKPEILSIPNGRITAYNPLCLFNRNIQNKIKSNAGYQVLKVEGITINRQPRLKPNNFICKSLTYHAGDNMALLNLLANEMTSITQGVYGKEVFLENFYVFSKYDVGNIGDTRTVVQTDIAVLPLYSDLIY